MNDLPNGQYVRNQFDEIKYLARPSSFCRLRYVISVGAPLCLSLFCLWCGRTEMWMQRQLRLVLSLMACRR